MKRKSFTILFLNLLVFFYLPAGNAGAQTALDWRENKSNGNFAIKTENLNLFDKTRNRSVPVALYLPVPDSAAKPKSTKLKLAVLNHGYGMKNTEYSFFAETLIAHGYFVASIQHEIAGDEPMPTVGKPSEVRRPFWERGAANILFVIEEIKRTRPEIDYKNLLLVGHSNGGDTAMLFAEKYPKRVQKIITLDNRRMTLLRAKRPEILSIRSSDQMADNGVLPTVEEQEKFGIKIVKLKNTVHNDMWDVATNEQKREMSEIISDFIQPDKTKKSENSRYANRSSLNAFVGKTPSNHQQSEAVDKFVASRMQDLKIPGLALAVLEDGKILKMSVYGQANLETGTSVKPESVFMIASLSKQFVAAAILLLQKDGKLTLDDRVSKYLDGFPESWKEITFRQLLTHTSGIVRDPADYQPYKKQPVTEVIEAMYPLPLNAKPGEKWLYSNAGYYVLAEAITKVSGKPWDKFIAERIFTPAGMTGTRPTSPSDIIPNRVSGYHQNPEGRINAENWIAVRPSGAFLSTIQDLAKWDAFLDKGDLLTEADRRLMWTQAVLNDNTPTNYGLGWYVDSYLGRRRINHDGQYPGFRADYERFPDDKLSVIVLANLDNRGVERMAVKIAGFYKETLAAPRFSISVKSPPNPLSAKNPIAIEIEARNNDKKAAPRTILEMEIWDEAGKSVYKQNKTNVDYAAGETQKYDFSWTPEKAGKYTVNVGTYGPRWTPDYTWNVNLATIVVN